MQRVKITEAQWERTVVDTAHALGWRVAGFRAARRKDGSWETPVRHEAKGYPDLTMARDRVIFVELKGSTGSLRPEQRVWVAALRRAGAEVYIWSPDDFDEVERVLSRRARQ